MSDFVPVAKVTELADPGKMLVEVDERLIVLFRSRQVLRAGRCLHA